MGIHQPVKAHLQRTIQIAVMSPYLFSALKGTVPFAFFSFLIIICLFTPFTSFNFLESFAYLFRLPFFISWNHVIIFFH